MDTHLLSVTNLCLAPFVVVVQSLCSWHIQRGMKPQGAADQDNAKLLKFALFRLIKNLRAILFGLSVLIANAQQEAAKIPHKRRLRHGTQEQVPNTEYASLMIYKPALRQKWRIIM